MIIEKNIDKNLKSPTMDLCGMWNQQDVKEN